ncbi:MAG TPA: choice-of-anchor D domain-containing protein [Terriglobales bacterium]|nr:choice-of-anchor D domain-containing protein [Terriglobales bacterium]
MRAKTVQESVRVSVWECALDLVRGRASQHDLLNDASRRPSKYPYRWTYALFGLAALAILFLNGCAGFVSGANTSPTQTLTITNVQAAPTSTSAAQIVWTTNVPADSSVDYGTTTSYGTSTSVNSTMVTTHQVTISGLAAGTTYYYQVNSTDTKSNHGKSGPHSFATNGFSISGTITPTAGGSGATVTLSGTSSASTKANGTGAFNFTGLPAGSYTLTPSNTGYTFTPPNQNLTISTSNMTGANFTATASTVAPTITTQPASQTLTAGQTATFTVVASGTAPLSYQWQKNGVNISGATSSSYTTPATTTTDSGSTFRVVVSNSAGSATSNAATLTVNAPAINVSPNPISFGSDVVGTNTTQALIIKNTGTATLSISQITASGAPFTVSGFSLPLSLNAGQQTTVSVAFAPTSATAYSGSLSITSNAPGSPTSVSLSGTGIAATLTLGINPTSLSFGNITTGTTSAAQTVTITNTGNSSVTISQITLSGAGYAMTGGSAPVTLSPSQNITLSMTFAPTVAGAVSGSISIVSNATGSPATLTLSGTGVLPHSVSLTWNASTSTVTGYNVYRSTINGSGYVKINTSLVTVLTYTDTNVQNGTTYYYVTTAVDSSGTESAYSNQATAVIP